MPTTTTTTWAHLETGDTIVPGPDVPDPTQRWTILDLGLSTITVENAASGARQEFTRKADGAPVTLLVMTEQEIVDTFGAHRTEEEDAEGAVTYFAWPDDPDFATAGASHLVRVHETADDVWTWTDMVALHDELHRHPCDHEHTPRKD